MKTVELVAKEESYKIIGACIKVHKKLGSGFSENVYKEALKQEFTEASIPFEHNKELPIFYNGKFLNEYFTADFICFDKVLLVIKVVDSISTDLKYQVVQYLKSTQQEIGLLLNYGEKSLCWKRLINSPSVQSA